MSPDPEDPAKLIPQGAQDPAAPAAADVIEAGAERPEATSADVTAKRKAKRRRNKTMIKIDAYNGPNPFLHRTPFNCYEKSKMILLAPLAVVRILLIVITFFVSCFFAFLASVCTDMNKPLPRSRTPFIWMIRAGLRLILFWGGFLWINVNDHRKDKTKRAQVIVANHVSLWEGFLFSYLWSSSGAAKNDLWNLPALGRALRALQWIPINRYTPEGRAKAVQDILDRVSNTDYPPLVIFPEGTTSVDTCMTMFKRGPFTPGVAVQPVALDYKKNKNCDLYLGHESMGYTLFYNCCQFVNYVEVHVLDVHEPTAEEKTDSTVFAHNVRQVIADHLKIPVTEHSFADTKLLGAALKMQYAVAPQHVMVKDVFAEFQLRFVDLETLLARFHLLDADDDGLVGFDEFFRFMGFGPTEASQEYAQHLFAMFDTGHDGYIDFGEFLGVVAVCMTDSSDEDALQLLFAAADREGRQAFSREDLEWVAQLARKPEDGFLPSVKLANTAHKGNLTINLKETFPMLLDGIFGARPKEDDPEESSPNAEAIELATFSVFQDRVQRDLRLMHVVHALLTAILLSKIGALE